MHPEALDQKSKGIFSKLASFSDFYLAGGTGLAIQIGHRISVDFDLFSEEAIPKSLLAKAKRIFDGKSVTISVNNPDELTIFVDGIKVSFIHYPFPRILEPVRCKGVLLLSIKEIAASKAYTIGRRGSYKDYIDLYFVILENYTSIQEIVNLAEKKYETEFNARLFFEQLVYLEDIEDMNILFLKKEVTPEELQRFFEEEMRRIEL